MQSGHFRMKWPRETGSFVKSLSKTLTSLLFFAVLFSLSAFSAILTEEKFNTHLRWNLFVDKAEVLITKIGSGFYIETLHLPLYKELKKELNHIRIRDGHFSQITFSTKGFPQKPTRIRVDLKDETVELFSFYREKDKKYVLDFWKSENDGSQSLSDIKNKPLKMIARPVSMDSKASVIASNQGSGDKMLVPGGSVKAANFQKQRLEAGKDLRKSSLTNNTTKKENHRDFRYGASLIWDYPPLPPKIEQKINIKRKTPEYFYPVKDRNLENKNDQEAHMQLSINLYRKKKYGLMSKSIKLYQKKYGTDKNYDFNEFLKALALIRENLNHIDNGPFKSAIAILDHITDRTRDYNLKKAIYFYNIQYQLEQKNLIEILRIGKRLYVDSKAETDQKTSDYAAQMIFYTLSQLRQVEKIKKFASEKSVQKLVAPQTILAYKMFVYHKQNAAKKVIELFQENKSQMQRPIDSSILYNVAEAYFRTSQYKKAIRIYHHFIKDYSHMSEASFVRVRLALSYELLESDFKKTLELYEDAINRSAHSRARYEAKLRYVAMRNTRKIRPDKQDQEVLSFLEYSADEKAAINEDLKILLWSIRLRILINSGKYRKALSYITALPIKTFKPMVKKMFEGDGAEIIYGMIVSTFGSGNPSEVIKLWGIYRELYEDKVAGDPYLNFVVAQSYAALGLEDSLQQVISHLKRIQGSPRRMFPVWVPRVPYETIDHLVTEINILKMLFKKDWSSIVKNIDQLKISSERKLFYETIALYHLKYFDQAIQVGEDFLRKTPEVLPLNKVEVHQFFEAYMESLYATGDLQKFKKAAGAILSDMEGSKMSHKGLKGLSEKIRYLLIESLVTSSNAEDRLQVEANIKKFLENHTPSIYGDRVRFLLASDFIIRQKKSEGLKILNELVKNENTSDYIKEMSKSEIASLKLDEKIIN